mgnify:CR=1 FL=1
MSTSSVKQETDPKDTVIDISHMVEDTAFSKKERNLGKNNISRKFIITGQTGSSESESDSSQQQLSTSISVIDNKIVITDSNEITVNNEKAVDLMAEEEKNILHHRLETSIGDEEIDLGCHCKQSQAPREPGVITRRLIIII